VLGPNQLSDFGRPLGSGLREFKDGVTGKEEIPRGEREA
jgi:Sec-independent protein translocase protein TatA